MKNTFIFLLTTPIWCGVSLAQRDMDPDIVIRELLPPQDQLVNYEEVYETLYMHYQSPINLNRASREELEDIYLLGPSEINSLLEYRQRYGDLVSVYELQAVPGWEPVMIRRLLPFVCVEKIFDKSEFLKTVFKNPDHYLLLRCDRILEKKKGYQEDIYGNTTYLGSPYKITMRYRNSMARNFSYGLIMEKDAGEQMNWNPQYKKYLMDFISFHTCVYNKGRLKSLAIGDFKAQYGQGLVFGGGFSLGKGSETVLSLKRSSRGIQPYGSLTESGFFRGIAVTLQLTSTIDASLFISVNRRDALSRYDTLDNGYVVTGFTDHGYHRSISEMNGKHNLSEQTVGTNFSFSFPEKKFRAGVSAVYTSFGRYLKENDRIYNRFDFVGKDNNVVSIDYSRIWNNINMFGEIAISSGGGKAVTTGMIASLSRDVDVSFLYRNFEKDFHSFYSGEFSEGGISSNEEGLYWGVKVRPHTKVTLSAYYDYYRFRWLKYFKDSPTEGHDYLGRFLYTPSRKIQMYFQIRSETAGKNQSDNITAIDFTVPSVKSQYMLNIDSKISFIQLRSRVQWSRYRQSNAPTNGFAISGDLQMDLRRLKISGGFIMFDTDDFDNRQYVYERDVLYAVSFPAYHGTGTRAYLIFQIKFGKKTDLWLRYSIVRYEDKETIGSGQEEVSGNRLRDLKVQIRYKFG